MFKKAVNSHGGSAPKSTPPQEPLQPKLTPRSTAEYLQKHFPPPVQKPLPESRERPRPLRSASGNVMKPYPQIQNTLKKPFQPPAIVQASNGRVWQSSTSVATTTTAVKRTSGGLAKTLSASNGFDDPRPTSSTSKRSVSTTSSVSIGARTETTPGTVFDDFDDFDLDFDDLHPIEVSKPTAFPKPDLPRINSPPILPQPSAARFDSNPLPHSSPEQIYEWSSSPMEHFTHSAVARQNPSLSGQSHLRGTVEAEVAYPALPVVQDSATSAQPSKRRKALPWVKPADEKLADEPAAKVSYPAFGDVATPASSKQPWNTSASAIKEQQKTLRSLNKNLQQLDSKPSLGEVAAAATNNRKADVKLSAEQEHVLDLVLNQGKSVFFTGSAGTGKSVLLREMIKQLRRKHAKEMDRVAVTASTGLAACNIGGCTLHSFAGIGIGKGTAQELVKKVRKNQKCRQRWLRAKILIIDEVSMVDADLFDKLEEVARNVRKSGKPFGGIQLVVTGDFFQLPPVPERGRQAKFAFDAGTWNTVIQHTIGLHHVFRQKDPAFANMLNQMREGRLTPESTAQFTQLHRPLDFNDDIKATELFPTRQEVELANNQRMKELVGDVKIFEARDGGTIQEKEWRDKLLENCMAPRRLVLKEGAQVMLIKNVDETLVNGSIGKVRGFMTQQMWSYYSDQGYEGQEDFPDESVLLRASRSFKHDPVVASFERFPLVRFRVADGTHRDLLCIRESWKIEQPNGEVQASRQQVPLILAWALSIHKAQGQTLERVKVDLGKVFEKGQAYVALSRATSMAGLQVLRFDPTKVMAHERVRKFYASLSRAEVAMNQSSSAQMVEVKVDDEKSGGGKKNVNGKLTSFVVKTKGVQLDGKMPGQWQDG